MVEIKRCGNSMRITGKVDLRFIEIIKERFLQSYL
jgi:hypothetical protein